MLFWWISLFIVSFCKMSFCSVECHSANRHCTECLCIKFHCTECHFAMCYSDDYHSAWHFSADWHAAMCHLVLILLSFCRVSLCQMSLSWMLRRQKSKLKLKLGKINEEIIFRFHFRFCFSQSKFQFHVLTKHFFNVMHQQKKCCQAILSTRHFVYSPCNWVRVNQHLVFPQCPASALCFPHRASWRGAEICRHWAENCHVNLPLPLVI